MSFCKISSQYLYSGQTIVDNIFVTSHLPNLDGDTVKVYLYGLYECTSGSGAGIETFSRVLGISEKKIWEAFEKLAKEGLVTIIEGYPKEVRYNPVTNKVKETKLYSREKYYNFNIQIQNIIRERMITPTEYKEYYLVIEAFNMEPDALVMIAKYATGIKGEKVGHAYITTLAKNWAREGCLTVEAVEKRLKQYEVLTGELKLLFDVLNIKKEPTVDDKTEYLNLKNQVALTLPEFFEIANRTKKTGSSFSKFVKTVLEHAEKGKGMASDIEKSEEIIRQIHDKIGRGEVISNQIRSLYRNWSYTLAMPDDVILYALGQSVAAGNPLLYLNRTLENWAEAGAKTL
ncbi:MAG: DnaD domain protein, partial [Firmicutes bacterium]|nr:DnaD domain protein [Bacillota bacterium]